MGTLKALGGFLAIILVVVACFEVAPPLMANYSFQDDLRNVALMDGANFQKTDDDIRNDVLRKAKDQNLPIDAKQVIVQRISTPGMSSVYVAADYTVTVSLPGYSFDMHFNPTSGNK
ncbi:MAG: hypothetical protein ABSA78_12595 [Candidatus Sulfotelmatobacter sp.]|jgi:hypothetical protein